MKYRFQGFWLTDVGTELKADMEPWFMSGFEEILGLFMVWFRRVAIFFL